MRRSGTSENCQLPSSAVTNGGGSIVCGLTRTAKLLIVSEVPATPVPR